MRATVVEVRAEIEQLVFELDRRPEQEADQSDAPTAPSSRPGCGPTRIDWGSLPGAVHDQELVFEEKRLRNYGTDAARSDQTGQGTDQMDEKND